MSFLHRHCKSGMCEDCVSIAEEYEELYEARKMALAQAQYQLERIKSENEKLVRERDMYKECAHAGVGEIISAWIDKEIGTLIDRRRD